MRHKRLLILLMLFSVFIVVQSAAADINIDEWIDNFAAVSAMDNFDAIQKNMKENNKEFDCYPFLDDNENLLYECFFSEKDSEESLLYSMKFDADGKRKSVVSVYLYNSDISEEEDEKYKEAVEHINSDYTECMEPDNTDKYLSLLNLEKEYCFFENDGMLHLSTSGMDDTWGGRHITLAVVD